MAKNLIWKGLSAAVNQSLERYKDQHDLKTNTAAAEGMITKYHDLVERLMATRDQLLDTQEELYRVRRLLENRIEAENNINTYLLEKSTKP